MDSRPLRTGRYNEDAGALGEGPSRTPDMKKSPLSYVRYALESAVVFSAYYFAAKWALDISAVNTFAAPIWPPSGIALAALYFGGYRLWPAVALAAFFINYTLGAPLIAALGIALGNTLEAWMAVYLLRNLRFSPLFSRLSDSMGFIATAFSVPFVSAVIGPTTLALMGELNAADIPLTSLTWWVGDALGILILGPFLLKWFAQPVYAMKRSFVQIVESILFFLSLVSISLFVFWNPIPALHEFAFPYLVFVPLTWGALRVGPRLMTAAIATVATIASAGTLMGIGPFATFSGSNELFLLQLFLATLSLITLLFVSAVEERKEAGRRLLESVESLQKDVHKMSADDRAKNEFIAILSHELRNPLAPVLSSLELLRLNVAKTPDLRETIETMYEQIQRVTRLLDDLLDIARISHKKFNLQMKSVSVQEILTHSQTTAEESIRKQRHVLTTKVPDEPILLIADPLRLEQVMVNLLNNAAKYTKPGGQITLSAQRAHHGVEIRVRDNGLGIPGNMQKEIFEPFRQAHATEGVGGGLGIGLSLAKRFIELHSGTIRAESAGPGMGSEFIVWLPVRPIELLPLGKAAPQPRVLSEGEKKKRTVLIVDDNEEAAEGIAKLLNHAGHTARTAQSGRGALQTLKNFHPEIIFLDIGLPGESGYDLARKIRREIAPTPLLVALTGYGQEDDKLRAQQAGFDYHLVKPIGIADLEFILTKDAQV